MTCSDDLLLAQEICRELTAGNTDVLAKITYLDAAFRARARALAYAGVDADDVVNSFWHKKILEQRVLCRYEQKNSASLKTFCMNVLKKHIYDENRKAAKIRSMEVAGLKESDSDDWADEAGSFLAGGHAPTDEGQDATPESLQETEPALEADEEAGETPAEEDAEGQTVEEPGSVPEEKRRRPLQLPMPEVLGDEVMDRQNEKIFRSLMNEAIDHLRGEFPEDADIVQWRLEEKSFAEIAALLSVGRADGAALREDAIKKRYSRRDSPTGCLFRLDVILEKILVDRGLTLTFSPDGAQFADTVIDPDQLRLFAAFREDFLASMSEKERRNSPRRSTLEKLSFARFALLYGSKHGHPFIQEPAHRALRKSLGNYLQELNMELGVEKGLPYLISR